MKEPTQEQIKKFWEWCGFYQKEIIYQSVRYPMPIPNYRSFEWRYGKDNIKVDLPELDLNSLFRYAVPKLAENESLHIAKYTRSNGEFIARIGMYPEVIGDDPALALFWAIYQAAGLETK